MQTPVDSNVKGAVDTLRRNPVVAAMAVLGLVAPQAYDWLSTWVNNPTVGTWLTVGVAVGGGLLTQFKTYSAEKVQDEIIDADMVLHRAEAEGIEDYGDPTFTDE